jgi:hypothetical protein
MANGWDVAMRRIDVELDIPQFLAAALVRKIAAHNFRLPAGDRSTFAQLPDDVIVRVEQIVRVAYLEADEYVGEDNLHDDPWQQALTSRREMIANGDLISEAGFRRRGSLTARRLSTLLADDSVFTIEVDGVEYFATLLAVPVNQRRSVYEICRVIATAPSDARLDFLTSRRERLGDRSPLEVLKNKDEFAIVSRMATVWASEWSRTSVKMYSSSYETEPAGGEPLYAATVEIDPRKPLWERASEALHAHGHEWPLGPCPDVRRFTLFVERQTAGDVAPIPEACVQIVVDGEYIRVRIVAAPGTALRSQTITGGKRESFINVAKRGSRASPCALSTGRERGR